ncbi:MAG: hypothetical protein JOY72_03605 [Actinobacteria bacterium]|nr:hypothetical protein [Actinomycetota bacterium]
MKRLALLLVAVLVLAACGGSSSLSKPAYDQHLQSDGNSVQKSVTGITKSPASLAAFVKSVDAAETAVNAAADDLQKIKPPKDAVADNAAIVAAFRAISAALEQVKTNPAGAAGIVSKLESSAKVKAAEKATADLKSKGYKVGVIGAP